jgi:hypothetical protein
VISDDPGLVRCSCRWRGGGHHGHSAPVNAALVTDVPPGTGKTLTNAWRNEPPVPNRRVVRQLDGTTRAPRRLGGAIAGTEQRHDAIAHVAGHDPGLARDGTRHPLEMALQLVDHVIGQQRLGEGRETAEVGEEDRHAQFLADRSRTAVRRGRPRGVRPPVLRRCRLLAAGRRSASSTSSSSRTRRRMVTSAVTRVWQARRNRSVKPSRSAITRSPGVGSVQSRQPSTTKSRHVEHAASPPHACANEMPARNAAPRMVSSVPQATGRWSGKMHTSGMSLSASSRTNRVNVRAPRGRAGRCRSR